MLTRSRALSLALSALLALSSFQPCYTLAYADEGSEVIADGQQDDRAAGTGDELGTGSEEPAADYEAGEGAAAGETEAEYISEVPSGSSPDFGSPAVSGLDGFTENEYSFSGGFSEPPVSESDSRQLDNEVYADSGVMPFATSFSVIDTLVAAAWSGEGTQFVIGSNKLSVKNGTIMWAVVAVADQLESILSTLNSYKTSSLNYQQAIDTAAKGIRSMLGMQWGNTYGSTAIFTDNSPAGWLRKILGFQTFIEEWAQKGYINNWVQWGHSYDSIPFYYQNSPAGWLKNFKDAYATGWGFGYDTSGTYNENSPAGWLRKILGFQTFSDDHLSNLRLFVKTGFATSNDLLSRAIDKMDNINVSVDVSGIESRLDDIKNLLLLAGTKDIIDTILGDLDDMASAALLGEVQAAAQDAFPFCIPFVVKQLLGLVESDPAAPEFDFVIGGETMHVDLSFAQGFVDILGWACRFLLVFGLVVSSRRFIYTGAVS